MVQAMEILRENQFAKGGKTFMCYEEKAPRDTGFDNTLLDLAAVA